MPRGAKAGNQNARKSGIYSELHPLAISPFYPIKPDGLANYEIKSLEPEIYLIRSIMERLAINLDCSNPPEIVGNYLNLFSLCATRLATLLKIEAIINPTSKSTIGEDFFQLLRDNPDIIQPDPNTKPSQETLLPGWEWISRQVKDPDQGTSSERLNG